jgi:hypothetical protein
MFSAWRGQDFHCDRYEPPVMIAHAPSILPIVLRVLHHFFFYCPQNAVPKKYVAILVHYMKNLGGVTVLEVVSKYSL